MIDGVKTFAFLLAFSLWPVLAAAEEAVPDRAAAGLQLAQISPGDLMGDEALRAFVAGQLGKRDCRQPPLTRQGLALDDAYFDPARDNIVRVRGCFGMAAPDNLTFWLRDIRGNVYRNVDVNWDNESARLVLPSGIYSDDAPTVTLVREYDDGRNMQMSPWVPIREPVTDRDGDGHDSVADGGDDCDDSDAGRFPGNVEVADRDGHDEDCDPTTFGFEDTDEDGYGAAWACNTDSSGRAICGRDCRDDNAAIFPTQIDICNNRDDNCDGDIDEDQPCAQLSQYLNNPDSNPFPWNQSTAGGSGGSGGSSASGDQQGGGIFNDGGTVDRQTPKTDFGSMVGEGLSSALGLPSGGNGKGDCAPAVQGNVAWNYQGNTQWADANVARLCQGAESTTAPAACFDHAMHGGSGNTGIDGAKWTWQEALTLCQGTQNADQTLSCYTNARAGGQNRSQAIENCRNG